MRSVGLVALGWRVPGAQAQGMVRACEQGAGREQCTWQVGRVLWLWGSERASEVTGARDGSAYGSLKKLTEAVEFKSRDEKCAERSVRQFFHAYYEARQAPTAQAQIPHDRSVRMHHSWLCTKHCAPGEDRGPPTWRCT
jgi:hypothetical protein